MLHEDWWIRVLRPNSVSTGCTDRQLDFAPQSPQPSQTRSLMNDPLGGRRRLAALALAPLLGRALLVVDQHGDAVDRGQLPLHVEQVVAVPDLGPVPTGSRAPREPRRVVGGDDDLRDALGLRAAREQPASGSSPTACWPPVIATAALYSSLKVMFAPAATAARMARLPEWANVPSPRFWTRCRCVDERRHADPLRALAAHLA